MRMRVLVPTLFAAIVLVTIDTHAAVVTSVFNGRVPCAVQAGVQFCPGTVATRVETWDGVPLDVNVTIPPASMNGPFPLIVDLHGWGIGKSPNPFADRALAGYVVLSYSARGFHQSCGFAPSRAPDPTLSNPTACTDRGWIRLADARYEVRDTQYLAGLLADEGLVIPDKVGVTGASYGGGQSMQLAALKDRVMLPDGTLIPWKSPAGTDMKIAAAAPIIGWSDLGYALVPNGRTLDYHDLNPYGTRAGVMKKSYIDLLYNLGLATGFYAASGADPDADLQAWKARLDAGEPYDTDALLHHALTEVTTHHSAYYIDDSEPPAPLFMYNATTDDLFGADESLRYYLKTRSKYPSAEIALRYADEFGHPRASLGGDMTQINARVDQLFARHLQGSGGPLPPLEMFTQGCGGSSVMGAFTAPDWESIHPGEVRLDDAGPKSFASAAGNATNAQAVDPAGAGTSCRTTSATDDPAAATYRLPAVTGAGYTLMGSPTVIADLAVDGSFAEVAARLWDVAPNNSQALVSQSLYRPRTDNANPQVFQLHPNGWHFTAGHVAKLELLGQSAPYGRASNGTFTVTVTDLELRLPVVETPGGVVQPPAPPVEPPTGGEAADCPPAPVSGCLEAGGSLKVKNVANDAHDRLQWKWRFGPGTTTDDFGNPTTRTDYTLCLYNGSSNLIGHAGAPHDGICAGRACWTANRRGYRYRDAELTPDGVQRISLVSGGPTAAKIVVKARGARLHLPLPPINVYPVTAQLITTDAACWETVFTSARRDTFGEYSATR